MTTWKLRQERTIAREIVVRLPDEITEADFEGLGVKAIRDFLDRLNVEWYDDGWTAFGQETDDEPQQVVPATHDALYLFGVDGLPAAEAKEAK
jgi:hypothetical protein